MSDIAALISDLVASGVSAELVGRVAAALAERDTVVVKVGDESADRRRAADRQRKAEMRLRKSAEVVGTAQTETPSPSPPRDIINPPNPTPSTSLRSVGATAPRKASRAKPRTAIAGDQLPTPADVDAAKRAGLDRAAMVEQWAKFRDYHAAKGSLMADWSAAWRTWLGNMATFQPRSRAGPAGADNRNGWGQIAAELWGENERTTANHHQTDGRLSIGDGAISGYGESHAGGDHRNDGFVLDLDPVGRLPRTG